MKKRNMYLMFFGILAVISFVCEICQMLIKDDFTSFIVNIVELVLLITTGVLGFIITKKYGKDEEIDNSLSEPEKQAIIKRNKKFAIIGISIGLVTFIAFLIYVFMQI